MSANHDAHEDRAHAGYSATAISLHWLVVLLIFSTWPLGLYMVDLPLSPQKLKFFSWHKWIGVTIFLCAVARLFWRLTHPVPAPPGTSPRWERRAAAVSHALLYGLILVIPISGWLYSSATGVPVVYLGLLQLPDLVDKDKELAALLKFTHAFLNATLFALVCMHVAAALKHHFLDRDEVLSRMLPFVKRRGKP